MGSWGKAELLRSFPTSRILCWQGGRLCWEWILDRPQGRSWWQEGGLELDTLDSPAPGQDPRAAGGALRGCCGLAIWAREVG